MARENKTEKPYVKAFMMLTIFGVGFYVSFAAGWTSSLPMTLGKSFQGWQSLKSKLQIWRANEEMDITMKLENSNETKIILIWHKPGYMKGTPSVQHSRCGNCEVTEDKSMINNSATGAVVFFFSKISQASMPSPSDRNPEQLHVFWTIEPPPHIRLKKEAVKSSYQFNASMSYRRTSDFLANYNTGNKDEAIKLNISASEILKMKTKGGVALVSNCDRLPGPRIRLKVLKKIQSLGFPLDGFGKCFPSSKALNKGKKDTATTKQYKFYFSFENSYHCRDYITEKLFRNALNTAVAVPVVWGATKEDYEAVLPKGSYIFAEDFSSLENLVDYLNYLMKNDTAYLEYFRWHKTEPLASRSDEPPGGRGAGFCQICQVIHGINVADKHDPYYDPSNPKRPLLTEEIAQRTMSPIRSFVFDEENKECNYDDETKFKPYKDWRLDE